METESKKLELKHLGFVRIAAIQALVCVCNLYNYAKSNSGPLRSAVGTVESAVTTVVGPVYERFKGVPDDILVYVDTKVNEASHKFDKHAPPMAKHVVSHAHILIEKALQKAQKFVSEAQAGGPRAALHYAAGEYTRFVLTNSAIVWHKLNHYAIFHTVAGITVPMAAHLSEKYNHVVLGMNKKGYPVVGYLPLVPIDEIAKAFKETKAEKEVNGPEPGSISVSD